MLLFSFEALLPDKPPNLTVTNIHSRSAEISSTAPQNTGDGRLGRFWIKLTKDNSLIRNMITAGNVTTYKVDKLAPYTTYQISVAAGNEHGFSEETIKSFTTIEEGKNIINAKNFCPH